MIEEDKGGEKRDKDKQANEKVTQSQRSTCFTLIERKAEERCACKIISEN